ncbi:dihydroorotate dehydrogenase electron transfer subunit [Candidatus Auribacterota bacterium]
MFQKECQIITNREVAKGFFLLEIAYPEEVRNIIPGQFAQIKLIKGDGFLFRKPFSISFINEEKNSIQLFYQVVGKTTKEMASLKPLDSLDLIAPLGRGFCISDVEIHLLLGGGIGIAPLYYLAKKIKDENEQAKLITFLGYKSEGQAILHNELKVFSDQLFISTDDGSMGEQGFVTSSLKKYLEEKRPKGKIGVYACGPQPMLEALSSIVKDSEISECQVSLEEYMACAVGACLGCVVKVRNKKEEGYQRVCKEGPVFNMEEIVWETSI